MTAAIVRFRQWAEAKGITATGVDIQETETCRLGLFATNDCKEEGTILAHIPSDLVLTSTKVVSSSTTALRQLLRSVLRAEEDALERLVQESDIDSLCLRLYIALEKFSPSTMSPSSSSSSSWGPYMDLLPDLDYFRTHSILFMDKDDDRLAGTSLEQSLRAKQARLMREHDQIKEYWPELTLEQWMWAYAALWSRVVRVPHIEGLAIIPFFDFANHSQQPNMRWEPAPDDGGVYLVSIKPDLCQSTEIFISYGDKSNQELLFLHGFTFEDNNIPFPILFPVVGFMSFEDHPDDIVKFTWLNDLPDKGKTFLQLSVPAKEEEEKDSLGHPFTGFGWTASSVAIVYLLLLDSEDGLSFQATSQEDGEERIEAYLKGELVESLEMLLSKVRELERFAVYQLQVTLFLLEAVEYRYKEISRSPTTKFTDPESMALSEHIERYRSNEKELLERSINSLTSYRDALYPAVLKLDGSSEVMLQDAS